MKNYFKNNKLLAVSFLVLMVSAVWVRTHNHHDWLYFKMDQARDAFLVKNALEHGPGELPLLGPRAGATDVSSGFLRLGPFFYYFQYFSAVLFNSSAPEVMAYPDLFFSILAIPLLYFFLRLYFSRLNSFLVTAMYALSFIAIQYSRFAWNPNSLLFFTLLAFYAMLKFFAANKKKQKIIWAAVWALGVAVGSQLHFLGLFCLVGISLAVIFLHYRLWNWKSFGRLKESFVWKNALIYFFSFLGMFLLIYSPVIISDVFRKGENAKNFIEAFGTKPNDKDLSVKIERSLPKQAKYYCLLTTSRCYQGKPAYTSKSVMLTLFIMFSGIILAIRKIIYPPANFNNATLVRKNINKEQRLEINENFEEIGVGVKFKKEDGAVRKDFLWLLLIWIGSLFFLAIPLYSSLRPRFFIFVFPVPFIFLGLIFEFLQEKFSKKLSLAATFALTAGILGLNIHGTMSWFSEQAMSQEKSLTINRTLILKNQDGVTLNQLEKAVDFIYERRKTGANIHFYVKPEHLQPIRYLFSQKNDPEIRYFPLKNQSDPKGQYFAIFPAKKSMNFLEDKFNGKLKLVGSKDLGQIKVQEVEFLENSSKTEFRFNEDKGATDRVFWKDVFGIESGKEGRLEIQGAE